MALAPGTRLGVFEISAQIGEGGMGAVYRATDTSLGRQVAIKVLPDAFAADVDRLARFEREAKTLASLNHPHIAAIYAIEKSAGATALVMELVEGVDLSERIAQGAIPLDEALPIAKQIAEALEAAHEQGIIHRDLKPANIRVRTDGTVKVLDFGLAKAMEPAAASSPSVTQSPTLTSPAMTKVGMILGSAAYMSPEQAKGRAVDKRSDIWAFGAVVYEMLTRRRAFPGENVTDTIVSVVSKEPDWNAVPSTVAPAVVQLLSRCLTKDVRSRLRDIGEARVQIGNLLSDGRPAAVPPATPVAPTDRRLAWAVGLISAVLIGALAIPVGRHLRESPPPAPLETRVDIVTLKTDAPTSFALSPDGRGIVYAASDGRGSRLWLRSLASTAVQALPGTEGASHPFWSPDGRSVGFFAGAALKRLDLGGGAPQTLAPVLTGQGGTWNKGGVILFAPSQDGPLMRVSATGGPPVQVTTLGEQQQGHLWPHMLPDGRFLFYVRGAPATAGVYLGSLEGAPPTRLTASANEGVYLPSGWLVWLRAGSLVAQRLDLVRGALTGEPVSIADGVGEPPRNRSAVTVATTGLVAYRVAAANQSQLTWVDRSGRPMGVVGESAGHIATPRVSPDGRRVAVTRGTSTAEDIWLLSGARATRLTTDPAMDNYPLWAPDGSHVAFRSARTGTGDIYLKSTDGAGRDERIAASAQTKIPTSWSADGRYLLYYSLDPQTAADIWVMPMEGGRTPFVFLKTAFREGLAVFSPDGRWVAYQSNESGRPEIYVRRFVPPGASSTQPVAEGQWQVSASGGIMPRWSRDGRELYFLGPDGEMVAAPITIVGGSVEPGAPVALFQTRIYGGGVDNGQGRHYDVAPDGRFLINTVLDSAAAPITLIQNWDPEAKQ